MSVSAELKWDKVRDLLGDYVATRIADSDERGDVVQRCIVKAWRRLGSFEGRSAFSTWLYTIARREVAMWAREKAARKRNEARWLSLQVDGASHAEERAAVARVDAERLIARLDDTDAEIVRAYYLRGLTSAEVGSEIGFASSSVRVRLKKLHDRH